MAAEGTGQRRAAASHASPSSTDLDDQVEASRRIFASDTRWTVVRGSDLEEGDSQGLPVWSRHDVGDPILESDVTRRVDFALFMVHALETDDLIHEPPGSSAAKAIGARACPRRGLRARRRSLTRRAPARRDVDSGHRGGPGTFRSTAWVGGGRRTSVS